MNIRTFYSKPQKSIPFRLNNHKGKVSIYYGANKDPQWVGFGSLPGINFDIQQSRGNVARIVHESFDGALTVKSLGREQYETERFASANKELTDVSLTVGRWFAAVFPLVMLVLNIATVAVIWFGGHRIDAGEGGDDVRHAHVSPHHRHFHCRVARGGQLQVELLEQ